MAVPSSSHRKLIRALVQKIRALRDQIKALSDEVSEWQEAVDRASLAASRAREEARVGERKLQHAEDESRSREYQRESAVAKLERAKRNGDAWGEQRALRELRNI